MSEYDDPIFATQAWSQHKLIALEGRWKLRTNVFSRLSGVKESHLRAYADKGLERKWENQCVTIPSVWAKGVRKQSFFAFSGLIVGEEVEASCMVIVCRRGDPATEEELDRVMDEHCKVDLKFLHEVMTSVFVTKVANLRTLLIPAMRGMYLSPAGAPTPRKQRFYTMPQQCLGSMCVCCFKLGKHLQCACKQSVHYCSKACQRLDWPRHKTVCTKAAK